MEILKSCSGAISRAARSISPRIFRQAASPSPQIKKATQNIGFGYEDAKAAMNKIANSDLTMNASQLGHSTKRVPRYPPQAKKPSQIQSDQPVHSLGAPKSLVSPQETMAQPYAFNQFKNLQLKPDKLQQNRSEQNERTGRISNRLANQAGVSDISWYGKADQKVYLETTSSPVYNKISPTIEEPPFTLHKSVQDESFVDITENVTCDESFLRVSVTAEQSLNQNRLLDESSMLSYLLKLLKRPGQSTFKEHTEDLLTIAYRQTPPAVILPLWCIITRTSLNSKLHHQNQFKTMTKSKAETSSMNTSTKSERPATSQMLKPLNTALERFEGSFVPTDSQEILRRYFAVHNKWSLAESLIFDLISHIAIALVKAISLSLAELHKYTKTNAECAEILSILFGTAPSSVKEQTESAFGLIFPEFLKQMKPDLGFSSLISPKNDPWYPLKIKEKLELKVTQHEHVAFAKSVWKLLCMELTTSFGFLNLALLLGADKFTTYMLRLTSSTDYFKNELFRQNANSKQQNFLTLYQSVAETALKPLLITESSAGNYCFADKANILREYLQLGLK